MTLYKQPKSLFWWFEIRKPDGTRIRKSTETSDRAKAEVIVRTFIMGVKRQAPADRLHAMLDAVCGLTNKTRMTLDDVWPAYTEWLNAAGRVLEKTTLAKRDLAIRRLKTWATTDYPAALEVASIDRATATAYASYLASQGLKGKTRQHILGDQSTIWEALRRARDGVDNPCAGASGGERQRPGHGLHEGSRNRYSESSQEGRERLVSGITYRTVHRHEIQFGCASHLE